MEGDRIILDIKYALLVVTVKAVRFEGIVGKREMLEELGAYFKAKPSRLLCSITLRKRLVLTLFFLCEGLLISFLLY